MVRPTSAKKRLVVSYSNLPEDVMEAFKLQYPGGYNEVLMRIEKPNGECIFVVPFETPEISYMVKVDVKIDDIDSEDEDSDGYDDDLKGADDIQSSDSDDSEDSDSDDDSVM